MATTSPLLRMHVSSRYSWLMARVHALSMLAIWGWRSTTSSSRAPVSDPEITGCLSSAQASKRLTYKGSHHDLTCPPSPSWKSSQDSPATSRAFAKYNNSTVTVLVICSISSSNSLSAESITCFHCSSWYFGGWKALIQLNSINRFPTAFNLSVPIESVVALCCVYYL